MFTQKDWAAIAAPSCHRVFAWLSVAIGLCLAGQIAHADYISTNGAENAPNFAEVHVSEDRVHVALEIDIDRVAAFLPDSNGDADVVADPALLMRMPMAAFGVHADGEPLTPEVLKSVIRPRKDRPIPPRPAGIAPPPKPAPRSETVVYVELLYRFASRPGVITLLPPMAGDERVLATIGFQAFHGPTLVNDYRYLSGPETLHLDWDDPWYSAFENPIVSRHNTAPVMAFLAIEPREVRHEIIFRLRDLGHWTNLEFGDDDQLDSATIERIKRQAETLLANSNPLVVDGNFVSPADVRVEQLQFDLGSLNVVETPDRTDRETAMFGAILTYPRKDLPDTLQLTWTLFPERSDPVPVRVTDPAGGVPETAKYSAPNVTWTNFLTNWSNPSITPVVLHRGKAIHIPTLSVLLAIGAVVAATVTLRKTSRRRYGWAALTFLLVSVAFLSSAATQTLRLPWNAPLTDAQTASITLDLLENISVAMLEPQLEGFIATLDSFVASDQRTEVADEILRGLSVSLPSGARAQVEALNDTQVQEVSEIPDGQSVLLSWNAFVSGGHWGHQHRRVVAYRALLDLVEQNGIWNLTGLTVLEARSPSAPTYRETSS